MIGRKDMSKNVFDVWKEVRCHSRFLLGFKLYRTICTLLNLTYGDGSLLRFSKRENTNGKDDLTLAFRPRPMNLTICILSFQAGR